MCCVAAIVCVAMSSNLNLSSRASAAFGKKREMEMEMEKGGKDDTDFSVSYEMVEHDINEAECLVDAAFVRLFSGDVEKCAALLDVLSEKAMKLADMADKAPREGSSRPLPHPQSMQQGDMPPVPLFQTLLRQQPQPGE